MEHFPVEDPHTLVLTNSGYTLSSVYIEDMYFVSITGQRGALLKGCDGKRYLLHASQHPSCSLQFFVVVECEENGILIGEDAASYGPCLLSATAGLLRFLWAEELSAITSAAAFN